MYTNLIIQKEQTKKLRIEHFKISINFYIDGSEYKRCFITTNDSAEVLTIANDLNQLQQWFMKKNIDNLIQSSLLKEYLKEEIFEMEDDGTELRFDNENGDFSVVWVGKQPRPKRRGFSCV